MSRHMSCALTIDAVRARTKTVTRRDPATWAKVKSGDHLILVEKAQGIPKGGHVVKLAEVEIVDVRVERLLPGLMIDDLRTEGVHVTYSPARWAAWWAAEHGWRRLSAANVYRAELNPRIDWWARRGIGVAPLGDIECRRIEWRYLDRGAA